MTDASVTPTASTCAVWLPVVNTRV
jgi:hypothetical protein